MGLELEIIYLDVDLVEVRIRCENGRFAGTADCYVGHSFRKDLITAVQGFPTSIEDRRRFELGTLNPAHAGGGVRVRLACVDAAGHAVAHVQIRNTDEARTGSAEESAEFSFPVEPAAVDEFVKTLGEMPLDIGAAVRLRQAI